MPTNHCTSQRIQPLPVGAGGRRVGLSLKSTGAARPISKNPTRVARNGHSAARSAARSSGRARSVAVSRRVSTPPAVRCSVSMWPRLLARCPGSAGVPPAPAQGRRDAGAPRRRGGHAAVDASRVLGAPLLILAPGLLVRRVEAAQAGALLNAPQQVGFELLLLVSLSRH